MSCDEEEREVACCQSLSDLRQMSNSVSSDTATQTHETSDIFSPLHRNCCNYETERPHRATQLSDFTQLLATQRHETEAAPAIEKEK